MDAISYGYADEAHDRITARFYSQEAVPTGIEVGTEWYKPSTGFTYKYINDGTIDVWIDISSATSGTSQGYVDEAIDSIPPLPIDEVVSHLASTGSTYVGNNLTEIVYTTGNKEVLTYNGDNTLDEVKYYDTDGTTLMLTTKQIYNVGVWSHETRTEV